MKRLNRYALTLTSAALICGTAAAQDRSTQQPLTQNRELKAGEFQASHLIGAPVKNPSGETVGTVEDLIVASGDVNLAVISVGGLLGVGDKKIALPYNQLSVSPDGDTLFVKMSEEELKAKPAFDPDADGDEIRRHLGGLCGGCDLRCIAAEQQHGGCERGNRRERGYAKCVSHGQFSLM